MIVGNRQNENVLQRFGIVGHVSRGLRRFAGVDGNNVRCVFKHLDHVLKIRGAYGTEYGWESGSGREVGLLEQRAIGKNLRSTGDAEAVAEQEVSLLVPCRIANRFCKCEDAVHDLPLRGTRIVAVGVALSNLAATTLPERPRPSSLQPFFLECDQASACASVT